MARPLVLPDRALLVSLFSLFSLFSLLSLFGVLACGPAVHAPSTAPAPAAALAPTIATPKPLPLLPAGVDESYTVELVRQPFPYVSVTFVAHGDPTGET